MGENTDEANRGRVMGFLEVEPKTIRDVDRMAPDGRQWKIDNRVTDRWTYAVPAVRAWRSIEKPHVREIPPMTLGKGANWQLISKRGVPLLPGRLLLHSQCKCDQLMSLVKPRSPMRRSKRSKFLHADSR